MTGSAQRLLSFSRNAYLFMDGIHVQVRLGEDPKVCLLIVIGVREDGVKELLAVEDGYRESTESWAGVFRDLKRRGLNEPKLVVGDGALGAWAALRCLPGRERAAVLVHASGNVIDALPKRLQPRAKGLLSEIIEAPTRKDAKLALEVFREEYGTKYPKALAKLDRDWTQLTAIYDYPAEHWRHLRTTDENVKGLGWRVSWFIGGGIGRARFSEDLRSARVASFWGGAARIGSISGMRQLRRGYGGLGATVSGR